MIRDYFVSFDYLTKKQLHDENRVCNKNKGIGWMLSDSLESYRLKFLCY